MPAKSLRWKARQKTSARHIHALGRERQVVIQRQSTAPIPLRGITAACVLNQNLPHQCGTNGDEKFTILELSRALLLQSQISLVHQGGTLQGVARTFLPKAMTCHRSQRSREAESVWGLKNPLQLLSAVEPTRERADGDEDYVVRNQRGSVPVSGQGFNCMG